LKLILAEKKC